MGLACHGGCPSAIGLQCTCTCHGSYHGTAVVGWANALAANPQSTQSQPAQRAKARAKTDIAARRDAIVKARMKRKFSYQPTKSDQKALIRGTKVITAVEWLVDHRDARMFAEGVLEEISNCAYDEISSLGPHRHPRLGHHLWCDILAALTHAVDTLGSASGKATDWASEKTAKSMTRKALEILRSSRGTGDVDAASMPHDLADSLGEKLLERLVVRIVKKALEAVVPGMNIDQVGTTLRILSISMCPNPSEHPRVWKWCLTPLCRTVTDEEFAYLVDSIFGPEAEVSTN